MRHRVLTNRQPRPGNSGRPFTPDNMPPRASSSTPGSSGSTPIPDNLYKHQLALAPRQDSVARLRAMDSPASTPSHRTVLVRRITEPVMPSPATSSPVFRFPEVGSGADRCTPTSLHEEQQPTVVEVNETGEAIYDVPRRGSHRSDMPDYEDVGVRSSFTVSLHEHEECSNMLVDSDSGYSPSAVSSPLNEAARQKPVWLDTYMQNQQASSTQTSPMHPNLLRPPAGGRESEPHYRAPRISPTGRHHRPMSPNIQGSSPRESIDSELQVSPAKSTCSTQSSEAPADQAKSSRLSPPSGSPSGYQRPNVGKRPPPVPVRDPETALSKPALIRCSSGNTFVKPSTPSESGSPVPSIQIHRPRMDSLSSNTSGCESLNSSSTFTGTQSPSAMPAMERIQRGWQRICTRQKLMNRQNMRASERRHRHAAPGRALQSPEEMHTQLTRQKSNPMLAMIGTQGLFSSSYENTGYPSSLFRAKSSPNLHNLGID